MQCKTVCCWLHLTFSSMLQMYKSVWNACIALSTKLRLYNTCILPIVLYASECWAPTKADVARLDVWSVVSPTYTRNYQFTRQDHITNVEVRERTSLPAVSKSISQRRLYMLGHMSRMPPSADAYKAIYQDIPSDWRRRPGRPQQSWLATIHRDLQKLDIGLDNLPELAADRVLWRGLIRGATHHSGACYWWWWWRTLCLRSWEVKFICMCVVVC